MRNNIAEKKISRNRINQNDDWFDWLGWERAVIYLFDRKIVCWMIINMLQSFRWIRKSSDLNISFFFFLSLKAKWTLTVFFFRKDQRKNHFQMCARGGVTWLYLTYIFSNKIIRKYRFTVLFLIKHTGIYNQAELINYFEKMIVWS